MTLEATLEGKEAPKFDENYRTNWLHNVYVSIFVRDLDKTDSEDVKDISARLTEILDGYDFSNDHMQSLHGPECPDEDTNAFTELDAKRKIDYFKAKMEKQK